jgi:hypothetical protein
MIKREGEERKRGKKTKKILSVAFVLSPRRQVNLEEIRTSVLISLPLP